VKQFLTIYVLLILLFSTQIINGQPKTVIIGFEGGPSLSLILASSGVYKDSEPLIGGTAGLNVQYNFTKLLSLKTGVIYERKGTQLPSKSDQLPPDGLMSINFDYLSIPILLKLSFGQNIQFFINTGPNFSYLFSQSIFYKPKGEKSYKVANERVSYKPFDIGVILGVGISIPIRNRFKISLEIKDNLGLMNVQKDNIEIPILSFPNESHNGNLNTTSFIVGFCYRL